MSQFHVEIKRDFDTDGVPEDHPNYEDVIEDKMIVAQVEVIVTRLRPASKLKVQTEGLYGIVVYDLDDLYLNEVEDQLLAQAFDNIREGD